jgi:hypothetical protein
MVPKSRGGRSTTTICRDCHKAAHSLFSNRELAERLSTPEALRADERFARMAAFLRRQDPRRKARFARARGNRKGR